MRGSRVREFVSPRRDRESDTDDEVSPTRRGRAATRRELPDSAFDSSYTSDDASVPHVKQQVSIDLKKEITEFSAQVADATSPMRHYNWMRSRSPVKLPGMDSIDEHEEPDDFWFMAIRQGFVLFLVFVIVPLAARMLELSPPLRCMLMLLAVLLLSVSETMPLYCVALCIPVLGSLTSVFGDHRTQTSASTLLLSSFFNQTSFLVMGSLVVNSVFSKCGVLDRMTAALLKRWRLDSKEFLLVMMFSTMFACSVLCSGSIVVLAAVKPLLATRGRRQVPIPVTKRLLLGIAFSSNAGSCLLPISSIVNLITVSLLRQFDHTLSLMNWVVMAFPIASLATLASWASLMWLYPSPREAEAQDQAQKQGKHSRQPVDQNLESQHSFFDHEFKEFELSTFHQVILMSTCMLLLGITLFSETIEPIVGHPAILAVCIVVLVFGSGFMSREEFLTLEWDLLAITGGTNVMGMIIRETALAAMGSKALSQAGVFDILPFWPLMAIVIVILVPMGSMISHSLSAVVLLPLLVAFGVKLKAAELLAMLCAIAIPFGMGTYNASFDNIASHTLSRTLGRKKCELNQRDFFFAGNFMAVVGSFLVLSLGFGIGYLQYGIPQPPKQSVMERTPEELEPKVVKENRVSDLLEISARQPQLTSIARRVSQGVRAFGRPRQAPAKRLRQTAAQNP